MNIIENIINSFPIGYEFNENKIIELLNNENYIMNIKTIRWRLYDECQLGNISKIGKKLYKKGKYKTYDYNLLSKESEKVYKIVKNNFQNLNIAIWDEKIFNEWLNLLLSKNIVFVEVEKSYIDFVYEKLRDYNLNVLLESQFRNENYNINDNIIVIKKLVTKAPINANQNKITLEKLIVDLLSDKLFGDIMDTYQIYNMVKDIIKQYIVNKSKLLSYAKRKDKLDVIQKMLSNMEKK